jgi:hypothetical protein
MKKEWKQKRGYKEYAGCHCCKFCFVMVDYEDAPEYYCNYLNDRPRCTASAAMKECEPEWKMLMGRGENGTRIRKKKTPWRKACDKWDKWASNHKVEPYGDCYCQEMKEEWARNEEI